VGQLGTGLVCVGVANFVVPHTQYTVPRFLNHFPYWGIIHFFLILDFMRRRRNFVAVFLSFEL
jgi:hypothetical protein